MIATARKIQGPNLVFKVQDINELHFEDEFDVVFSNAALHWLRDHDSLLSKVRRALTTGGKARFNFAGDGNCSNFFAVVREAMALPRFQPYFMNMVWPWFMPTLADYGRLVGSQGFSTHRVWTENADRHFTEDELIRWIDQPSIVPLLARVAEKDKRAFRDLVVDRMIVRTRTQDGRYFETFRRMNLSATK
jgi:trans-aconitate 2-methyltransferase